MLPHFQVLHCNSGLSQWLAEFPGRNSAWRSGHTARWSNLPLDKGPLHKQRGLDMTLWQIVEQSADILRKVAEIFLLFKGKYSVTLSPEVSSLIEMLCVEGETLEISHSTLSDATGIFSGSC